MQHLIRAFAKLKERKWDCIYIAIDVHGTIIRSSYKNDSTFDYYPDAERVLKYLSTRSDVKIILYTSSHTSYIDSLLEDFVQKHIYVDYVNENPEVETNKISNFGDKFHFDVLLDDKAGFNADKDWQDLYNTIIQYPNG